MNKRKKIKLKKNFLPIISKVQGSKQNLKKEEKKLEKGNEKKNKINNLKC